MSAATKKGFRHRQSEAEKLAARLERLARDAKAFPSVTAQLEPIAESLKKTTTAISGVLSRQGRKHPDVLDRTIEFLLLRVILPRNPDFDLYSELSDVIADAFIAAGVKGEDTIHITNERLRKIANGYRKGE